MNFNIKKLSAEKIFISLIIVSMAFENFKLFTVLGAQFKPIQAVATLAVVYYFFIKPITFKKVAWALIFLLFPLAPLYRISDKMEFFKTYFIYTIIVFFVLFALPYLKDGFKKEASDYYGLFNNIIIILCLLGIVQFILMNAFGIMFLDGVFGRFQFHFNNYGREAGFYRAYSIFHEPSYFGWVLDIALAVNLVIKDEKEDKRKPLVLILIVATIVMTLSSSAIWIMAVILLVYFISIKRVSANAIIITPIVLAGLVFVVYLFDFSFVTETMERLFYEAEKEGTSAYERLKTPIEYIKATMEHYPLFGRGFGQEGEVDKVGIIGRFEGVHNAVFGIITILGITSIFPYVWLFSQFFGRKYGKKQIMSRILLLIATIGMYFSTGASISFDTFVFTIIIIFFLSTIEIPKEEEIE
ncbi:MAG: hypothetical protein IJC80_01010 [Clostridia bacterium]|nr:hypothetical protein [Clostridia bacterium]